MRTPRSPRRGGAPQATKQAAQAASGAPAFPVTPANIHEFLRHMLVDGQDMGKEDDDKAPSGFLTFRPWPSLAPEDYHIVEWTEDRPFPPFLIDPNVHGVAYVVAMTTLLHLRRWWYESEDYLANPPKYLAVSKTTAEVVLRHMADDLDCVIDMLSGVRDELLKLASTLPGDLRKAGAESVATAKAADRYAQKALDARQRFAALDLKQRLRDKLTQGSMELLAGVAQAEEPTQEE